MTRHSPQILLTDLIEHARRLANVVADRSVEELSADRMALDAALWNLIVLGEIVNRTTVEFRDAHPQIPWSLIVGQRNIIAHGYDIIDAQRIHKLAQSSIPELITEAQKILNTYGPPPEL